MKITCERSKLLAAVQAAAEVSPSRPTRPIAQGILLDCGKDLVEAVATDYDIGIRYRIDVKEREGTGRVVVPAAQFLVVVRDSADGDITLVAEGDKVQVTAGSARVSLRTMNESDFPEVAGMGTDRPVKLPAAEVVGMFDRVSYAAGQEESRYAINGVFVKIDKREIEAVATDARRLALVRSRLSKDTKMQRSAILPLKLVGMLRKVSAGQEELEMVLRENEAVFSCGPAVLVGRLVEGTYPKYEDAIPKDCDQTVSVEKEPLRSALKQAMNFTTEETRSVNIRIGKGRVVIEASVSERGEASIALETGYKGPEMDVAFNAQYFLDLIGRLEKDAVEMQLKDSTRPMLVCEGKDSLAVIMPVRLRGD